MDPINAGASLPMTYLTSGGDFKVSVNGTIVRPRIAKTPIVADIKAVCAL